MRLPEDQIKEGIVHEHEFVRQHAVRYFSDALSSNLDVLPRAFEAVDIYGWDEAFEFIILLRNLAHTEPTLLRLIHEIEEADARGDVKDAHFCLRLGAMVADADLALLMQHESRILDLPGFPREYAVAVNERLRLAGEDSHRLWQQLEAFCEREKDKQYVTEVDMPHAFRLVEAIAREPGFADRVLDLVAADVDDDEPTSMRWMEPLAIHLAGEMRLDEGVPALVSKLRIDTDLIREECVEALTKIGSDTVLEQICAQFPGSEWHYRLYATSALENLRSDHVVTRCVDLAEDEPAVDIKANLVRAVLNNFAPEGIEPARELAGDLCRPLLAVSLLTGEDFPERDEWMDHELADSRRRRGRLAQMMGEVGDGPGNDWSSRRDDLDPERVLPIRSEKKPRRNDPCPCGSGMKYKKCCMGKDNGG